jgi:phenylacetic acid degradation operon negative regulatory protein
MRREGWFTTRREGRQTSYALTSRSLRMLDEGRARIFDRGRDDWDGTWRMVIYAVPEQARAERERVRRTLAWHGFGPLAAATWVSPHPRLEVVRSALADLSATRLDLLECRSLSREADREMAFRCWDLDGLGRDYVELISDYRQLPGAAALAALPGQEALRREVGLTASYRALPFRDPDLPAALLPEGWPGRPAHALFTAAHDALHGPADAFVRDVVSALSVPDRRPRWLSTSYWYTAPGTADGRGSPSRAGCAPPATWCPRPPARGSASTTTRGT